MFFSGGVLRSKTVNKLKNVLFIYLLKVHIIFPKMLLCAWATEKWFWRSFYIGESTYFNPLKYTDLNLCNEAEFNQINTKQKQKRMVYVRVGWLSYALSKITVTLHWIRISPINNLKWIIFITYSLKLQLFTQRVIIFFYLSFNMGLFKVAPGS